MAAPPPRGEFFEEMVVDPSNVVPNGEAEIPGDDGPWSISVADAPSNNKKKYTIYIQTPTQNLTLTRAAQEITDLHAKLRSNHPSTALPPLPGFPTSGTDTGDAKRRSSFLNILSRLANPNPKPKPGRIGSVNSVTNANTPTGAPQRPNVDEPANMSQPTGVAPGIEEGEQTMPALAAYLTLVGNHPIFRHSRAWRRFVRVRTDDLQSVRAERMVKRVRSESPLGRTGSQGGSAASPHAGHDVRQGKLILNLPSLLDTGSLDVILKGDKEEAARVDEDLPNVFGPSERTPLSKPAALPNTTVSLPPVSKILASPSMQQLPTPGATPTASPPRPNLKGPAPAEHRLSSGSEPDNNGFGGFGIETETEAELGAEGETTTDGTGKKVKKKREKKPARKVVVDDFEMMCVLGKGCAGK
ncbi:hypothetical protein FRC11_001072, partial [Ceratobasidium sp. 423]